MSIAVHTNLSGFILSPLAQQPIVDSVGMKFERLLVLEFYGRNNRTAFYRCKCDCGNICIISQSSLRSGKTKSCGCYHADKNRMVHSIDISGKRYGRLVALSYSHRKSKNTIWNVVCDCGVQKQVNYSHLVEGRTKSCGCIKRELMEAKCGERNHLWMGGVSSAPWSYPKEWNDTLRANVRNRDRNQCQYPNCTHSYESGKPKLDVHHIDGNKQNCESFNLISLCHSHHMKVEMSPRTWEDYFYSITGNYDPIH